TGTHPSFQKQRGTRSELWFGRNHDNGQPFPLHIVSVPGRNLKGRIGTLRTAKLLCQRWIGDIDRFSNGSFFNRSSKCPVLLDLIAYNGRSLERLSSWKTAATQGDVASLQWHVFTWITSHWFDNGRVCKLAAFDRSSPRPG